MNTHVDSIMANHAINIDSEDLYYLYQDNDENGSDASSDLFEKSRNKQAKSKGSNKHHGGANDSSDVPTGGFPPIFIIDEKEKEEEEKVKNRQLAPSGKAVISIKDILKSKK